MNFDPTQSALPRHDWTPEEVSSLYNLPFPELLYRAHSVHRENFSPTTIQRSTLLSIKTGGCSEDCKYCSQSSRYNTEVEREGLLDRETVVAAAKTAKENGSSRFCMGAAWRHVKDGPQFDQVLDLVSGVDELGLEVCCTLGMLSEDQARRLKEAGCHSYNHNLDTSREYYGEVITTRKYDDRLNTLKNVRRAGISVCCGGIIGMGERLEDRLGLLVELSHQEKHPESVPINQLVRVQGTPLAEVPEVSPLEFVRMIATTRLVLPQSMVRLSAGRMEMSVETQALCFFAGANSIFAGEKLLTTPNPGEESDESLMAVLGMSFAESGVGVSRCEGV